jgi:predicted permease
MGLSVASVLLSLITIVIVGASLRYIAPDLPVDDLRLKLNRLVLMLFLPALNFNVVYAAKLEPAFWQVPLVAVLGLATCMMVAAFVYSLMKLERRIQGALIPASAFGNVTYLGFAILQGLYPGANSMTTVVLYEMTITPLNLAAGSVVAAFYANTKKFSFKDAMKDVARMPLIWAVAIALILNVAHVPLPDFFTRATGLLSDGVSGIMTLSLGMALKLSTLKRLKKYALVILPCIFIKLFVSPMVVLFFGGLVGLGHIFHHPTTIEAAMPCQLMTLVVADKYNLDTDVLALAVITTTLLSFFTIPCVFQLIS